MSVVSKARAVEKVIITLEKIINHIGMFMLVVIMLLGTADVIGRFAFNSPVFGTLSIQGFGMAAVIWLGWAYTLSRGRHVTVDIFTPRYPPRVRAIVGFVALLLVLALFGLVVWQAEKAALADWKVGTLVPEILIPVAPFKLILAVGAFSLCLECIIQMIHLVPEMAGRKEG